MGCVRIAMPPTQYRAGRNPALLTVKMLLIGARDNASNQLIGQVK
jgi:hypothetical protein